jgi:PAS domain S-box-containing protein
MRPAGLKISAAQVAIALACVGFAFALRVSLFPILSEKSPFLIFLFAVIVSSWYAQIAGGLIATILSAIGGALLVEPIGSFAISDVTDIASLAIFILLGVIVSAMMGRMREAVDATARAAEDLRKTESEYRALFEQGGLGAAEVDPNTGRLLRVNDKLCETTGYSRDELLGKTFSYLTHPDDRAADFDSYRRLVAGEITTYECEKRCLHKNGQILWTRATMTGVFDARGRVIRSVVILEDISARRRAAEAQRFLALASVLLGSSLDRAKTIETLADNATRWLCDYCIIDLVDSNGTVSRATFSHRDRELGKRLAAIAAKHPPDREKTPDIFTVMESGVPLLRAVVSPAVREKLQADSTLDRLISEIGIGSYMIVPLVSRGRMLGTITLASARKGRFDTYDLEIAQDLAARAALAIDNAMLYQQSQEANRAKDEFLATVSHELRTPMTAILGWSQLLLGSQLDQDLTRTAIESVHRSALANARIVDDILDLSKIAAGKMEIDQMPVDLRTTAQNACSSMQPVADARKITLDCVLGTGSCIVQGDQTRLHQMVVNLLSNGIKFTPQGGRVSIRVDRVDQQVVVTVRDTGIGIRADFLPHIFDPFRQADTSTTRTYGGLGLGLAIVKRLADSHGASVTATSEGKGHGTTFTVVFPALVEDSTAVAPTPAPAAQPDFRGVEILLVEDDQESRAAIAAMLSSYNARVSTAASAEEAIEKLQSDAPDILLSDIAMPGEDGYSLIRRVRDLENDGNHMRAIAISAYGRNEDRERAIEAGFEAFVRKPVDPAELARIIGSVGP